jgi:hypothetical protein
MLSSAVVKTNSNNFLYNSEVIKAENIGNGTLCLSGSVELTVSRVKEEPAGNAEVSSMAERVTITSKNALSSMYAALGNRTLGNMVKISTAGLLTMASCILSEIHVAAVIGAKTSLCSSSIVSGIANGASTRLCYKTTTPEKLTEMEWKMSRYLEEKMRANGIPEATIHTSIEETRPLMQVLLGRGYEFMTALIRLRDLMNIVKISVAGLLSSSGVIISRQEDIVDYLGVYESLCLGAFISALANVLSTLLPYTTDDQDRLIVLENQMNEMLPAEILKAVNSLEQHLKGTSQEKLKVILANYASWVPPAENANPAEELVPTTILGRIAHVAKKSIGSYLKLATLPNVVKCAWSGTLTGLGVIIAGAPACIKMLTYPLAFSIGSSLNAGGNASSTFFVIEDGTKERVKQLERKFAIYETLKGSLELSMHP